MKMSTEDYLYACNAFAGYCAGCDAITQKNGVEQDAEEYECPACDERKLMGVEQAMLVGKIRLTNVD